MLPLNQTYTLKEHRHRHHHYGPQKMCTYLMEAVWLLLCRRHCESGKGLWRKVHRQLTEMCR